MKNLLFALLLCPFALFAQDRALDLTLTFKDLQGAKLKNMKVVLIETTLNEQIELITDNKGVCHTLIESGDKWSINFMDIKEYDFVELPTAGTRTQRRSITYLPEKYREEKKVADRTGVKFDVVNQKATMRTQPTANENILALKVVNREKRGLSGVKVALVNADLKKKFIGTTDTRGWAYFLLPKGKTYEIDVPGIEAFKQVDIPNKGFVSIEFEILFVPTNVNETAKNDTTVQNVAATEKATTERVLMRVFVRDFNGNGIANEDVFWDDTKTNKVITAKTNDQGYAYFLLPKNKSYVLNLTYEREIELFSFSTRNGAIANGGLDVTYRGTQFIEDFYKTTKRNKDGFVIEFMETPVENGAITGRFFNETKTGYQLDFETQDMMYTPMVIDGKLYTSHGFYSNDFSCFDAETGKMLWSTELGEGGASPAAYYDGYVLLITESCSFYLIDAENGQLAWSKWLAPYVICTPSASDGKIYVVYENDATGYGEENRVGKDFVMACFDIKSGDIVWQEWIDSEGLSTPVIAGENVYLSTHSGRFYVFNKLTGESVYSRAIDATSAPTITETHVFVSRRVEENSQALCVIDKKDWNLKMVSKSGKYLPGAFDRMSHIKYMIPYEGSRPLIKDDVAYYTVDNVLYARTLSGKLVWQKGLTTAPDTIQYGIASMPILSGKNIMVATYDGRILTFNTKNGNLENTIQVGESMSNQLVLAGGAVYAGSVGKVHMFNTGDKDHTDWPMWNGDSEHNTWVE
ncbi:MAG: PQQ-binding-like beta-propeller repeat protein [Bacteroidia bacterium]